MYNKNNQRNSSPKMKLPIYFLIGTASFLITVFLSSCVINVAPSTEQDTKKPETVKPISQTPVKTEEKPVPAPPPSVVRGPGNIDVPPPPPYIPPQPIQTGPGNL